MHRWAFFMVLLLYHLIGFSASIRLMAGMRRAAAINSLFGIRKCIKSGQNRPFAHLFPQLLRNFKLICRFFGQKSAFRRVSAYIATPALHTDVQIQHVKCMEFPLKDWKCMSDAENMHRGTEKAGANFAPAFEYISADYSALVASASRSAVHASYASKYSSVFMVSTSITAPL